jgi:multisubunit Na+/H+ antiporter MnhF subunit
MLNNVGPNSTYLATEMLNPHRWNAGLPALPIRNQYVLDVLFALMLLSYIIGLVRQRWDRSFAHAERTLVFLSGSVCWLILAGGGRSALLPLVATNLQHIGESAQSAFTAEGVAALCILLSTLVSLLWLLRTSNMVERIVLSSIFVIAALCALLSYLTGSPLLLLIALPLLLAGTLIATRSAYVQTHPVAPSPAISS